MLAHSCNPGGLQFAYSLWIARSVSRRIRVAFQTNAEERKMMMARVRLPRWTGGGRTVLRSCLLTLTLAASIRLDASDPSSIAGRVTDPQAAAVAGARLTLAHVDGTLVREATTDESGNFVLLR